MITPINSINNNLTFNGQIKKTQLLDKALIHFSKEQLYEFNQLRAAASKINDGKLFRVFNSCASRHEENSSKVFYTHGVGFINEDNKIISQEVFKESLYNGYQWQTLKEFKESFAKSILEPLRKIYGDKG